MKKHNDLLIVLAAGQGTRMGRFKHLLPKHLLPYRGRAIISHVLDSFPSHTQVMIVLSGHDELTQDYLRLVYPTRDIEYVYTDNPYPGNPLSDLSHAVSLVKHRGPVYITVADGVYTLPRTVDANCVFVGTRQVDLDHHYTMVETAGQDNMVFNFREKKAISNRSVPWIGVARFNNKTILARNLTKVLADKAGSSTFADLFASMLDEETHLYSVHTPDWTDLGTERLYIERAQPSDWEKPDRVTYFDKNEVVKFFADQDDAQFFRRKNAELPISGLPYVVNRGHFVSYTFVEGRSAYEVLSASNMVRMLDTLQHSIWSHDRVMLNEKETSAEFWDWVLNKLETRVAPLEAELEAQGLELGGTVCNGVLLKFTWSELVQKKLRKAKRRFSLQHVHGDLTLDNMVVSHREGEPLQDVTLIDWRPRTHFDEIATGDVYYDLGKLYLSLQVDLSVLKHAGPTIVDTNSVYEIGFASNTRLDLLRQRFVQWCKDNRYDMQTIELYSVVHMASMTGCHGGRFPLAFYFASLAKAHTLLKI